MSDSLPSLITRGAAIKAEQKALKTELENIQGELIKAGPGDYVGTNGEKVKVVGAFKKFEPDAEAIEQVRELLHDEETQDAVFKKLFTRSVVYTAVKGVRHVLAALLTPAKQAKVISLCEVPSAGFVMWPK